jgi:hypothetical protein
MNNEKKLILENKQLENIVELSRQTVFRNFLLINK